MVRQALRRRPMSARSSVLVNRREYLSSRPHRAKQACSPAAQHQLCDRAYCTRDVPDGAPQLRALKPSRFCSNLLQLGAIGSLCCISYSLLL